MDPTMDERRLANARLQNQVICSMGFLFNDPEYSDFTVVCDNKSFKVHKAFLAKRSPFFASVFRQKMQESITNVYEFEEEDPKVVGLVLLAMYCGGYANHQYIGFCMSPNTTLLCNVKSYALAEKLGHRDLKEAIRREIKYDLASIQRRLEFIGIVTNRTRGAHVHKRKDDEHIAVADVNTILEALALVWTTTPEFDRGLRDLFLKWIDPRGCANLGLLPIKDELEFFRQACPEFPDDAFNTLVRHKGLFRSYECPECGSFLDLCMFSATQPGTKCYLCGKPQEDWQKTFSRLT